MSAQQPELERKHPKVLKSRRFLEPMWAALEEARDLDHAFEIASWLARFYTRNFMGIYRDDKIERELLRYFVRPAGVRLERSSTLHVITEAYPFGGHTLALKVLSQRRSADYVLVTGNTSLEKVVLFLAMDPRHVLQPKGANLKEKIESIARTIAGFGRVLLHIHPDDLRTAIGVRLAKEASPATKIGFFNHADHSFSTAIGAADHVFEISTYGWQLRGARGIEPNASFVGIPINTGDWSASKPEGLRALTGGSRYKFAPVDGRSLAPALSRLLSIVPELRLTMIGPRRRDAWASPLLRDYRDRIELKQELPHAHYLRELQTSSLYIDSFPRTGGTSFPEALMLGVGVVGLRGGTWGYSPADRLRSNGVEGFVERASAVLRGDRAEASVQEHTRELCRAFHEPAAVRERIDEGMTGAALEEPPTSLLDLGPPPLLAENEWLSMGGIDVPTPDPRTQAGRNLTRIIAMSHGSVYGWADPESLAFFYRSARCQLWKR